MTPVGRTARRRARRAVLVAVIAGTVAASACNRDNRRAAATGCAACGLIGWGVGVVARDEVRDHRLRAACGDCGAGRVCNHLHQPPRCTPDPAGEGDRCGYHRRLAYRCGRGLRCTGARGAEVCVSQPREGAPCDHRVVTTNDECAYGLTCGRDDRCHRICPDCPDGTGCNPLDSPPRCLPQPFPPGARCGRFDRGARPVWFGCDGVCVERAGVARCERSARPTEGPRCADGYCPRGMRCDLTVCVPGT